jgi:hypothetical protein
MALGRTRLVLQAIAALHRSRQPAVLEDGPDLAEVKCGHGAPESRGLTLPGVHNDVLCTRLAIASNSVDGLHFQPMEI